MINETQLEQIKMVIIAPIEKHLAQHFTEPSECALSQHVNFNADEYTFRIIQKIWGHFACSQEVRYPANWREAIKERFAPQWFKRRWPVVDTVIVVKAWELFPGVNPGYELHNMYGMPVLYGSDGQIVSVDKVVLGDQLI